VLRELSAKTIEKLYSPKFIPSRDADELGCRITTVIDRKTQEPVEVFVAAMQKDNNPLHENWIIMTKTPDGELELPNGERAHIIGDMHFFRDPDKNMLTPKFGMIKKKDDMLQTVFSYMRVFDKDKYAGVGLRLHQLRMERMFGCGFDNALIVADGNSFLFHYKSGFRITPMLKTLGEEKEVVNYFSYLNNKTPEENAKYLKYAILSDNKKYLDYSKSLESMMLDHYIHSSKPLDISPDMMLSEGAKADWWQLINLQPILLSLK